MLRFSERFEVIVIGGGHAGTEAALAAARMGLATLLLTQNVETLGQMSCNPAIGGIGKGHLVKEIDALGGLMAQAADQAAIQLRTLNGSKGAAVRATRAQADRQLYKRAVRRRLESQSNLRIFQQEAADLVVASDRITGIVTESGIAFAAGAVVLTVGTFLAGKIHVGLSSASAGRAGEAPSLRLAARLRELCPRVGRLKTGTPPRIDGRSIDFEGLSAQHSDEPRPVFSYLGSRAEHPMQIPCHLTATNERTHAIIRGARDRSPLFTGAIEGTGPRYCPSVEDKVARFADRPSHQIFIEPEGLDTNEIYPNGISTSLPFDVQMDFVRSIRGFERAHITRPGYAIEYDFYDPRDLTRYLESKAIGGLFLAGQINGTTGYEEAAAQGLLAGINAALKIRQREPWCPARSEAYLGVLVDDLVTRGAPEPYRMFTSRAEYRLSLREDNADHRLTPLGRELGLVDDRRFKFFERKHELVTRELDRLSSATLHPGATERYASAAGGIPGLSRETRAIDLLRRPDMTYADVLALCPGSKGGAADCNAEGDGLLMEQVAQQVEVAIKYEGYLKRQQAEIERQRRHEELGLPEDIDYAKVAGLSNEARQRLGEIRPATLGQAARIPGLTPAALSLLLVHLKKRERAA